METFVANLTSIVDYVNGIVWGLPIIILIIGTGLYLTFGLRFISLRKIPYAFKMMWRGRENDKDGKGEISPFNALMTALAATVGTGNIVGVAGAISIGGPGALFWMWMTALVGMATKFGETVLAVHYREVTPDGNFVGGPMFYIKNGLGKKWAWMGALFALFGALACFGIGNMTQSNAVAGYFMVLFPEWAVGADVIPGLAGSTLPKVIIAAVMFIMTALVVLGGVKRIGNVAGKVVPFMCLIYIAVSLVVILMNIDMVIPVFKHVVYEAFTPTAAVGGFAGAVIMKTIQMGVARGIFSNEAGLGSAAMAHATAVTGNPVRMGFIGMLGTFIDTIMVCSMTAFVILVTDAWTMVDPDTGAQFAKGVLTSKAFSIALPGNSGGLFVAFVGILFAYTTILGWCVYGERCAMYFFGDKILWPFRFIFVCVVPMGVLLQLDLVWNIADTLNGMMAIPNLIGLIMLSPVLFKLTQQYLKEEGL